MKTLSEKLAVSLVTAMRKYSFKGNLKKYKYLILLPMGQMMFVNDLSFYDLALAVLETSELTEAINGGKLGDLIKKKTAEYC